MGIDWILWDLMLWDLLGIHGILLESTRIKGFDGIFIPLTQDYPGYIVVYGFQHFLGPWHCNGIYWDLMAFYGIFNRSWLDLVGFNWSLMWLQSMRCNYHVENQCHKPSPIDVFLLCVQSLYFYFYQGQIIINQRPKWAMASTCQITRWRMIWWLVMVYDG